jgi:glycosyltransferase involved in cell wall biosynthesis
MRVACLCTDSGIAWGGPKGAAVHLAEISTALAREGATVRVFVSAVAPDAPSPPPGVTLEALPGPGKGAPARERVAAQDELAAWLVERLGAFGAEALYERVALYSAAGARAARSLGLPYLVELNAPLLEEASRYRTLELPEEADRLERETLAAAGLCLPVSSPLAAYASGRGARRVVVTPNAVTLSAYGVGPRAADGRPLAVFSGALRPWHGIETIAEAWRLLGERAPRLRVIGDGPGREAMQAAGAELTGAVPHDRVPGLLCEADIGLAPYAPDAPSYFSPLKLFEYLAAGLAIVAADLPGVTDVVSTGSAVLIAPGDARALAEGVAALAADPARRRRLGAAARALAPAHTWDRRARAILEAVAELAHPRETV